MKNLAIIDLETTGLDPARHEIIEIGLLVVNPETSKVISKFEVKVEPTRIEDADPKALEVNGYNEADWVSAIPLKLAMYEVSVITQGALMMSYNVSFDAAFLQAAFERTGVKDTMDHHRLDIATLAWEHLPKGHSLSLKEVATTLGIPPEPAIHRAMNGALCAYEVLKKILVANWNTGCMELADMLAKQTMHGIELGKTSSPTRNK